MTDLISNIKSVRINDPQFHAKILVLRTIFVFLRKTIGTAEFINGGLGMIYRF